MSKTTEILFVLTCVSCAIGQDIKCFPNRTIQLTNPNSEIFTHFTAFYDVGSRRTDCKASADRKNEKIVFDCGSTTATLTVFLSDRSFSDNILGGEILAFAFQCGGISSYTASLSADFDGSNDVSKPTYNITSALYSSDMKRIIRKAELGEVVHLVITSPGDLELVPLQCNASGIVGESVPLITHGCSQDLSTISSFTVKRGPHMTTYTSTFYAFDFFGSNTIDISCDLLVCFSKTCSFNCEIGRRRFALPRGEDVKPVSITNVLAIQDEDEAFGGSSLTTGSLGAIAFLMIMLRILEMR